MEDSSANGRDSSHDYWRGLCWDSGAKNWLLGFMAERDSVVDVGLRISFGLLASGKESKEAAGLTPSTFKRQFSPIKRPAANKNTAQKLSKTHR